jgi:sugar phosphate permease
VNPRYTRWRVVTFGITWLIYGGLYFTRNAFSMAKVGLEGNALPDVRLTREQMGRVDSTYLATYMLGQFVFGALGDRFGPRRLLLGGLVLSVLAAVGSGYSSAYGGFLAFAILQGIAQSTGWSNTSKVMASWFTVPERGRIIGWWCTHYTVGSALALWFAEWAMVHFGSGGTSFWPAAFWGAATVVGIIAVLSWFFLVDQPEDLGLPPIERYHADEEATSTEELVAVDAPEHSWEVTREVLSSPGVWLLAVAYFPVKLVRYAFTVWGPLYVADSLGKDIDAKGLIAAAMPWGGLIGVIAIGWISDRLFQSRRAPASILSLLGAAAVICLGFWPIHNVWVMCGFFFFVGAFLFGPDSIISATASMDFGTKRGAGTATGFVNGVGSAGSILGGILPPYLAKGDNWAPLFYVMFIGLFASALLLLPLWRTRPPTA